MFEFIHVTAQYSNAVLIAILPFVSDFAKKLYLPIPQPITASQVLYFGVPRGPIIGSNWQAVIGGGLVLTNHYWFCFEHGRVDSFRSPDNWFTDQDPSANDRRYVGSAATTTNQALELARDALRKLGYEPDRLHADGPPNSTQGPFQTKMGPIPFYRMRWEHALLGPSAGGAVATVQIDVNLATKAVTALSLINTNVHPPPRVDVVPEMESAYQQRLKDMKAHEGKMFIRSNAPPHLAQPNKN